MPTYKFTIGHYPPQINPKIQRLIGQRFGYLLVIGYAGIVAAHSAWHCLCKCGNGVTVPSNDLLRGRAHRSCGCWQLEQSRNKNTKHGETVNGIFTSEYTIYQGAKTRCQSLDTRDYKNYGAKGIEFRFQSFEEFLAVVGRRLTPRHSLDRYPNYKGHYEPGNVRWATPKEQGQNRYTTKWIEVGGKKQCISDWAHELRCSSGCIATRLKRGWCQACAVSIAPNQGGHNTCIHPSNWHNSSPPPVKCDSPPKT